MYISELPPECRSIAKSLPGISTCSMPVGDLLGDVAILSPGKARLRLPPSIGEVRVAAMAAGKIGRRHDDQPTAHVVRLERADQLASPIWPSHSSPWLPADQHDAGTVAVLDPDDRDRDPAVGRAVHRVRHAHESASLALGREIDVGREPAHRRVGRRSPGAVLVSNRLTPQAFVEQGFGDVGRDGGEQLLALLGAGGRRRRRSRRSASGSRAGASDRRRR